MPASAAENFAAQARATASKVGIVQTIHAFNKAINDNPADTSYKNEFLKFLQPLNICIISNTLKSMLIDCLMDPDTQWQYAGNAWYTLLLNDPSFKPFPKLLKTKKYADFVKKASEHANAAFWNDPYFVYGLGRTSVLNLDFERFITHLRRYLLEHKDAQALPASIPYVLARYCHRMEYVFFETEEEKELLSQLQSTERDQVMRACYRPIENATIAPNASPAWDSLAAEQINALKAIQQMADKVIPLTKIGDEISALVRSMYEKFPYPTWETIPTGMRADFEKLNIQIPAGAKILAAGCGTGKEALELATAFPDAQILAVDLSTTSLGYAQSKADQFNVKNITFRQADILKIREANIEFDFISSSGVLHHMQNPFEGWSALVSVLKKGAGMRIGLYSTRARWAINAAEAVIAEKGYPRTDDGMRRFRHDSRSILKRKVWKNISGYHDFYFLNEICDMLFHVQEHQFTPLELAGHIDKLQLSFQGFFLHPSTIKIYNKMFPDDLKATSLINWDRFEHKHPTVFRNMLQFWCTKN